MKGCEKMRTLPENLRTCPRCGKHYEFHSMMVGNQNFCPDCREDILEEMYGKKETKPD
jgi:DNA-directed RNA polymerase subunit RPC12/RpoP